MGMGRGKITCGYEKKCIDRVWMYGEIICEKQSCVYVYVSVSVSRAQKVSLVPRLPMTASERSSESGSSGARALRAPSRLGFGFGFGLGSAPGSRLGLGLG